MKINGAGLLGRRGGQRADDVGGDVLAPWLALTRAWLIRVCTSLARSALPGLRGVQLSAQQRLSCT
jgi:hypothetical protein